MSAIEALEQRLRTARPDAPGSPPPLATVLALIERTAPGPLQAARPRADRWRRRSRTVAPLILATFVLAGAGGGVLLLQEGKPLPPAYVLPANPQTGLGQPLATSVPPLPIRVLDPAGGPPWGMRVIRTTRGLVCLQGGRIVNGELGGLGSRYAFDGDGRFHPFLPDDAIATDACPAVGAGGHAFLPGPPVIVPANALPLAGENVSPVDRIQCDLPGEENWGVRCPQSELRQVAMGLLGSDVTSIEVTSAGRSFKVRPFGPEGAYMIVMAAQPDANASMSSGAFQGPFGDVSNAPGGAVLKVTYADGSRCQIPITAAPQQCHARANGPEGGGLPSAAPLNSDVHVGYLALASHTGAPLLAWARGGTPSSQKAFTPAGGGPGPALAVSFRAPAPAPNASTAYVVEVRPQQVAGCATPSVIVSQPSEQTISVGQQVQITVPLEDGCATSDSGRVFLARSSSIGGESGGEGPLYEAIAAQFGVGAGRSPLNFPTVGRFQISVP